ncbi:MAG: sulfatase [Alphaproteobacteria bacterium]
MRTILCLFDSLNRGALGCYGGTRIETPNFDRFSARALTFDNHYVGSLPCMPARRDLHTGRLNFMHRSWGPLEPFDNSFPVLLHEKGVHSHLVTDHLHYFEDGGSTYHSRFTTWDFIRGQEYDPWKAMVQPPLERFRERYADKHYPTDRDGRPGGRGSLRLQHAINTEFFETEQDYPGPRCFESAFQFLDVNRDADDWLLMLECFDPHEPFQAPERFKEKYRTGYNGGILDWPYYEKVTDSTDEIAEIRANYAALVAMCDEYFGRLLDYFDEHDLWDTTALILTTDHGFLLSEHDWWGKNLQPYYSEIAHIPLIVHDPRKPEAAGERRSTITQTYDPMPTLLDLFEVDVPAEVQGVSVLSDPASPREVAVYGMFGGPIGVCDGRFAYHLYPDDLYAKGLHEYTLMPMHLSSFFSESEMQTAELAGPFDFTKRMPVMKIDALSDARRLPIHDGERFHDTGTRLYDLEKDPEQANPINDPDIERALRASLIKVLAAHDCPPEIFTRLGLRDT